MPPITDLASARAALIDATTKLNAVVNGPVDGEVETEAGPVKTLSRLQSEVLAIVGDLPELEPRGEWNSLVTYAKKDSVSLDGISYVSCVDDNLNHSPDLSPTQWQVLADGSAAVPAVAELQGNFAQLKTAPHIVPLLVAAGLVWAQLTVDPLGKPISGVSLDNVEYTIEGATVSAVMPNAPLPVSVPLIAAAGVVWDRLNVDTESRPGSGLGLDGIYYSLVGDVLTPSGGGIQNAMSFGYSAVPAFRAWGSNIIGVTIVLGQSLGTGLADAADGDPEQTDPEAQDYYQTISGTPLHPDYALMFDAGAGVGPWLRGRAINGLTDLREVADTTYSGRLESICSSYADVVLTEMQARLGYKRQMLMAAVGESGYSLPQLTRGSDPWAEVVRLIQAARDQAALLDKTAVLMNIVMLHGESSHTHGIEPYWYARELSRVLDDAQAEARYHLGQIEPVKMIVAPPARGYRSSTLRVSPVQLGMQLAAATDHRIVVGSPNYAVPHGAGGGHPNPRGYRRMGYALGDAAVGHVHADGWIPLMPDEWWWVSSAVLRIKYRMPGPRLALSGGNVVAGARSTLVIDTSGELISVPSGNGRGYRAVDDSGEITINSVALVGGTTDQIDVTLAGAPGVNFRLLYAARGDAGAVDDGGGAEVGPRGVIRCDMGRTITDDSVPVYHWAIPHEIR